VRRPVQAAFKVPRSPLRASSSPVSPSCARAALPLRCRYLDSFPPRDALRIFKVGFLFCAAEFANHCLNHCNHCFSQFQGIGEDR